MKEEKEYRFYGWRSADVSPVNEAYKLIRDPRALYDILSEIWCRETCAPRMRDEWTKENITLGQCSITAFLAQDIFGGRYMVCQDPEEPFTATMRLTDTSSI